MDNLIYRLGVVGQEPECCDSHEHGRNAFDNKDPTICQHLRSRGLLCCKPSPSTLASDTIHVANTIGKQSTESSGKSGRNEQVSDPDCQLFFGVEKCQVHS